METDRGRALRGATVRQDGPGVIAALEDLEFDNYLQLAGDGLLVAVAHQADLADEWSERCAGRLRARGWDGDEELAIALEAAIGNGPSLAVRALPVDLDDVAEVLEGNDFEGGAIDLCTGEVWNHAMIEYADEIDEAGPDFDDDTRWLYVPADGPSDGYRDMQDFITTIDDPSIADRLTIAIDGKGAFRRFRDALQRWEQIEDNWYRLSDERRRGRARAWLASAGYHSTGRRLSSPDT